MERRIKSFTALILALSMMFSLCFTACAEVKGEEEVLLGYSNDDGLQWIEDDTQTLRYAKSKDYNDNASYTVRGKVNGSWVKTVYNDAGYSAAIEPASNNVTITIEPSFYNNAVKLEYTLTNQGTDSVEFRFWVGADTQIGVTDRSVNKANATHTRLTMAGKTSYDAAENDALFTIDSKNQGFYVKSIRYDDFDDLSEGDKKLDDIPELTSDADSGFLATWPAVTLAPGESVTYYTLSRVGEAVFVPVKGITTDEPEMLDDDGSLRNTYEVGDYFDINAIAATPSDATNPDITWDETTLPPTDDASCLTTEGRYTVKGIIPNGAAEEGTDYAVTYSFTVNGESIPEMPESSGEGPESVVVPKADAVPKPAGTQDSEPEPESKPESEAVAARTVSSDEDEESKPAEKPAKTGTMSDPVDDGTWVFCGNNIWIYKTNAVFKNTWGCIYNPYAKDETKKYGWFYFDENGTMLVGWQKIAGKWYYLNPVNDGTFGMCYMDTVTPDGKRVDENGVWIEA